MAISVEMCSDEPVIRIKVDSRLNYQMVCNARQTIAGLIAKNTTPAYCITELSLANVSLTETMETIKLLTRNLSCKNHNPQMNHYFIGHNQLASFASSLICRFDAGKCQVFDTIEEALTDIRSHAETATQTATQLVPVTVAAQV